MVLSTGSCVVFGMMGAYGSMLGSCINHGECQPVNGVEPGTRHAHDLLRGEPSLVGNALGPAMSTLVTILTVTASLSTLSSAFGAAAKLVAVDIGSLSGSARLSADRTPPCKASRREVRNGRFTVLVFGASAIALHLLDPYTLDTPFMGGGGLHLHARGMTAEGEGRSGAHRRRLLNIETIAGFETVGVMDGWVQATGAVTQPKPFLQKSGASATNPSSSDGSRFYATGPTSAAMGLYYVYSETTGNSPGSFEMYKDYGEDISGISYYYHMYSDQYGDDYMGTANLFAAGTTAGPWTQLWTKDGNQGDAWHVANPPVAAGLQVLKFTYSHSDDKGLGDFALDHIAVAAGSTLNPSVLPTVQPTLAPSDFPSILPTPEPTSRPTPTPILFQPRESDSTIGT